MKINKVGNINKNFTGVLKKKADVILPENDEKSDYLKASDIYGRAFVKTVKTSVDKEYGTIIVVKTEYDKNGGEIKERTEAVLPEVTYGDDEFYVLNGEKTGIKKDNNPVEITLEHEKSGYKWYINGENSKISVNTLARSRIKGSGKTVEIEYANGNNIKNMTETIFDKSGNVKKIFYTKLSDILRGVYDVSEYNLQDYPENADILSEIKNGTIKGGKVISKTVKSNDGSVIYTENSDMTGVRLERKYVENKDKSFSYDIKISGKTGNPVFILNRTFKNNPDGSTETVLNGKKYTAVFDDEKKIVKITDDEGNVTVSDINSKISKKGLGNSKEKQDAFWEHIKKLSADKLLLLDKTVGYVFIEDGNGGTFYNTAGKILSCSVADKFIISHELGHASDMYNDNKVFENDKILNETYKKELENLSRDNPLIYRDIVAYFSLREDNDGLKEIIAEASALFEMPSPETNEFQSRSHILINKFPLTIARIGEITGYNALSPAKNMTGLPRETVE